MPSSSPRCAQFPRAQDKVHFYIKLKELRDQMKGLAPGREVQETQYSFNLQLAKGTAFSGYVQLMVSKTWAGVYSCCFCFLQMSLNSQLLSLCCRGCKEDGHQGRAGGSRVWKLQWASWWNETTQLRQRRTGPRFTQVVKLHLVLTFKWFIYEANVGIIK